MAKINWTSEAERWLKEIYNYIAEDNRRAAIRTINAIYDKAQIVSDFPQMGYKYSQIETKKFEYSYLDIIVLPI